MSASGARVVLVVGVGRSGTSLAMQALRRLGAGVAEQLVPASSHNRRGAVEDWRLRDEMMALWNAFDRFDGIRPAGWVDQPAARRAEDWLEDYLRQAAQQPEGVYACKYPLAALFLPIWLAAARRSGVPLTLVWATRRRRAVIASQERSYRPSPQSAAIHFRQRTMYLMHDLPGEALLLPYEGWRTDPEAQVAALAAAAGLRLTDPGETLHDLYVPAEDHSPSEGAEESEFPQADRAADEALAGRLGPLASAMAETMRNAIVHDLMERLMQDEVIEFAGSSAEAQESAEPKPAAAAAVATGKPEAEAPSAGVLNARAASILREERNRLREDVARLLAERDAAHGESARLRSAQDALRAEAQARAQEVKEARAEAKRMRRACEVLSGERDRGDALMADMASRHAAALGLADLKVKKFRADVQALRKRFGSKASAQSREITLLRAREKRLRARLRKRRGEAHDGVEALNAQLALLNAEVDEAIRARRKAEAQADRMQRRHAAIKQRLVDRETAQGPDAAPAEASPSEAVHGARDRVPGVVRRSGRLAIALPRRLARVLVAPR